MGEDRLFSTSLWSIWTPCKEVSDTEDHQAVFTRHQITAPLVRMTVFYVTPAVYLRCREGIAENDFDRFLPLHADMKTRLPFFHQSLHSPNSHSKYIYRHLSSSSPPLNSPRQSRPFLKRCQNMTLLQLCLLETLTPTGLGNAALLATLSELQRHRRVELAGGICSLQGILKRSGSSNYVGGWIPLQCILGASHADITACGGLKLVEIQELQRLRGIALLQLPSGLK